MTRTDIAGTPRAAIGALLLPAGALLLALGMMLTVLGIPVPALFRPGTWLILLALLVVAAGAIARVPGSATDDA